MNKDMKILVFGDIHGRTIWKDIAKKEQADLTVFLGDYVVSRENISEEEQLMNLDDILDFKEAHPDEVILLRGNHDTEAAGYRWAECYPDFENKVLFPRERYERLTQWVYVHDGFLFSHAGVSDTFLRENNLTVDELTGLTELNDPRFGFTPGNRMDFNGNSIYQPPTWIRPEALAADAVKGFTQVVGHTVLKEVTNITDGEVNIWLCDALGNGSYLCIEDGVAHAKHI